MRGKDVIEEIDFLKSQSETPARIISALEESSVKTESLKRLLYRHKRADLLRFLFPRAEAEPAFHEHGEPARYDTGCRCFLCKDANNDRAAKQRKERAKRIDPADPRHGTGSFYRNHGCRCEPCSAAAAVESQRQYRNRLATPIDPNDPRHGHRSFYNAYGCRCEPCKAAAYTPVRRSK